MTTKAQKKFDPYVVVETTSPTNYGCHSGHNWTRVQLMLNTEVKVHDQKFQTYDEAVEHAKRVRNYSCWFEGYDEMGDYDEEEDLPPYNSAVMENYDNDEEVLIEVRKLGDINKQIAKDKNYLKQARERQEKRQKVQAGRTGAKTKKARA